MTAAVTSRRLGGSSETPQRRRKGAAFVVAAVVVAAGVAGATYVSSAYFTDTQTVGPNSVTTTTVELDVNAVGGASALAPIAQVGLVPAKTADLANLALETPFEVKNSGTGRFTFTTKLENVAVTTRAGAALVASSTQLSEADAKAKVHYQFGSVASNGTVTWSPTIHTLSGANTDVLTQTTPLAAAAVEKYKVRVWLDEAGAVDNKAQDLKVAFDLKFDATQALS